MSEPIYLDHNATTPLRPEAKVAMARAMEGVGNASSVHGFGRAQRRLVEDAREAVAALCSAQPANVVFTSGGSEANNTILRGTDARTVLVSAIEHASVLDARHDRNIIPVNTDGVIDLAALADLLAEAEGPVLVSVMAVNNETGVIQPIEQVAEVVHGAGGKLHVDAVQAAGKIALQPIVQAADWIAVSAHKMGGPVGAGALIVREARPFEPLIKGGGQERRRRAGTENVVAIAGFGAAATAAADLSQAVALSALRDQVESEIAGDAKFYGAGAPRVGNTLCVGMPGVTAETQVMSLDLAGIAVSAGSACSSGKVEPSHVLLAMGASAEESMETVRVSFGWSSQPSDAVRFVDAWRQIRKRATEAAA